MHSSEELTEDMVEFLHDKIVKLEERILLEKINMGYYDTPSEQFCDELLKILRDGKQVNQLKQPILKNQKIVMQLQTDLKNCFKLAKDIAIRLKRGNNHSFDGLFSNSSDGWELEIQKQAEYLCETLSFDLEKEYGNYLKESKN